MTKPMNSSEHDIENRRRFLAYFSGIGLASTLLPGVLWAQLDGQHPQEITFDMLKAAERIAGLQFTDGERELLIADVNQHLEHYEHIRKIHLDNNVVSCLRFSPILPGMKFDNVRRPMKMSQAPEVQRPANLEDAAFWPVTRLAHLIRTRQVR